MTILFVNRDKEILVVKIKKRDRLLAEERDKAPLSFTELKIPLETIKNASIRPFEAKSKFDKLCKENVHGLTCRTIGDTFFNIRDDPSKTILVNVRHEGLSKLILQVEDENTPEEEMDDIMQCVTEWRRVHAPLKTHTVQAGGCTAWFAHCFGLTPSDVDDDDTNGRHHAHDR